jgi:hypothetical protein
MSLLRVNSGPRIAHHGSGRGAVMSGSRRLQLRIGSPRVACYVSMSTSFNLCALRHWEPSIASNLSFVRFSNPWPYRTCYGCHGPEFRWARRCGRCDHRRGSWRPTRRGSGSRHGCRCRSPSRPALAWPLLLASRSLLGSHRWKVAPRVLSLLQVVNA